MKAASFFLCVFFSCQVLFCADIELAIDFETAEEDQVFNVTQAESDIELAIDFETVEEDQVFNVTQAESDNHKSNLDFLKFIRHIKGLLGLPQTYDSALSDLLLALRNDQKWKEDPLMRREMFQALRKAGVHALKKRKTAVDAIYQIQKEAFELWPPGPERASIVGLMNGSVEFYEKQKLDAQKEQEKADAEAIKEEQRLQKEQEKNDAQQAAQTAKKNVVPKDKVEKLPRARAVRQQASAKPKEIDTAELSSDVEKSAPAPRRSRARQKADVQIVQAPESVQVPGYVAPERFEYLPQNVNNVTEQNTSGA